MDPLYPLNLIPKIITAYSRYTLWYPASMQTYLINYEYCIIYILFL